MSDKKFSGYFNGNGRDTSDFGVQFQRLERTYTEKNNHVFLNDPSDFADPYEQIQANSVVTVNNMTQISHADLFVREKERVIILLRNFVIDRKNGHKRKPPLIIVGCTLTALVLFAVFENTFLSFLGDIFFRFMYETSLKKL